MSLVSNCLYGVACRILGSGNPGLNEEVALGLRPARGTDTPLLQKTGSSFFPCPFPSCQHQTAGHTLALRPSQNSCDFGLNLPLAEWVFVLLTTLLSFCTLSLVPNSFSKITGKLPLNE